MNDTASESSPQRVTRQAQILAIAEQELQQRIIRRRVMRGGAGGVFVAAALLIAWAYAPFSASNRKPEQITQPDSDQLTADAQSGFPTASRLPSWISKQGADGRWLSATSAEPGWLIADSARGDWLTDSPPNMTLASDDDLDQLAAQMAIIEERGVLRIAGRVVLAKDLIPTRLHDDDSGTDRNHHQRQ